MQLWAVSSASAVGMWATLLRCPSFAYDLGLDAIVEWVCPVLRGWVNYYGLFYPSQLRDELRTIDEFLVRWLHRKYKRFPAYQPIAPTGGA